MIINRYEIGTGKNRRNVYGICADVTETGDHLREIVRFDQLDTAALVLRYMNGGDMTTEDQLHVLELIKAATLPASKATATART